MILSNCEYGRQLEKLCSQHNWEIDGVFAFYYRLPEILKKHEKAEKKKLNKQKEKQQKVFRKDFPAEVDEDFVAKTLQLTPWTFERRKKANLLVFKDGKFSGKLLSDILLLHQLPDEIEDRVYTQEEVCILTQKPAKGVEKKYRECFGKEAPWEWSKAEVVEVMKNNKNKLRIL